MRLLRALAACAVLAAGLAAPGLASAQSATKTAIFAGGCFWCTESDFDHIAGVVSTTSGYTGGHVKNPSYEQVSAGGTGHYESVKVEYDPSKVTYQQLVDDYWTTVDPLDSSGQFCDHGQQYRTAIFVAGDQQRQAAEASKARVEKKLGQKVDTKILPAGEFYPAEDYHQNFYKNYPLRYKTYRYACGRDARLKELWGDAAGHHS